MKRKRVRGILSFLLALVLAFSAFTVGVVGMSLKVHADDTVGSSWTVDSDGALSLSETAANKAVGALNQGNMILIGTKG